MKARARFRSAPARRSAFGLNAALWLAGITLGTASAQPDQATSPRDAAPIDLTGQWVAIVNEDWRWRMVTPPVGDFASVPLNGRGREVAQAWDPETEGSCLAYGAAGLMRMPLRLRIDWDGDDVLEIETDAGRQTRRLYFDPPAAGAPTLQGRSQAEWLPPAVPSSPFAAAPAPDPSDNLGTLKVVTTNLQGAWLRRNGVPYSDQTTMTEYFSRFRSPDGAEWFVVTTIVDDPVYLSDDYITSSHFRRESSNRGWRPEACRMTNGGAQ